MYKVAKYQMILLLKSPNFFISLILAGLLLAPTCMTILEFATMVGKDIGIFDAFNVIFRGLFDVTVIFSASLLFFSCVPFNNPNEKYLMLRTGKSSWLWGKIFFIAQASILFYIIIFLITVLFTLSKSFIWNYWSEPMYQLATSGNIYHSSYFNFAISYHNIDILKLFTPIQLTLVNILLFSSYTFTMMNILFLFNMIFKKAIGFSLVFSIHMCSYLILNTDNFPNSRKFLPLTHAIFTKSDLVTGQFSLTNVFISLLYFFTANVIIISLLHSYIRYKDFDL